MALALAVASTVPGPRAAAAAGSPESVSSTRFERLTSRDGLSQNTVYAIEEDDQGFLWLGTKTGLNRYDGYDFRIFAHDPFDPGTLAQGFVRVLRRDRSGALWIGTNGSGLDRFDPVSETFTHYRHDPEDPSSLADDDVRAIYEDRRGTLWIGTRRGGLHRFAPESATFVRYRHDPEDPSSLADDDVRAILEDGSGRLWIGTDGGGLDRLATDGFDGEGSFVHHRHDPDDPSSLIDDRVRAICEGPSGDLWIGTSGGLDRFDPATGAAVHYRHDPEDPRSLSDDRVRSCHVDRSGRVWIGTRGGLDRFDDRGFVRHRHDPEDAASVGDGGVYSVFEDRARNLWVGTYHGGLNRLDPDAESFLLFRHDPRDSASLSSDQVTALHEDRDHRLWVGTFGGGLDRLDRRSEPATFVHYRHDPADPGSLSDDRVRSLLSDRAGRLWVGTFGNGLSYLDPGTGRFGHYRHDPADPSSLSDDDVRCLAEDRSGTLWVGTYDGGLNRFDRARQAFQHFRHRQDDPTTLGHDRVRAILEDRAGRLWIGTDGGLDLLASPARPPAIFTHFRHDLEDLESLSHDAVSALHEDPTGRLWIGTYGGGLNRLDPSELLRERPAFVHYRRGDGLGDDIVFGILGDQRGRLWMSTSRGLVRFDPAADRWTGYDVRDGLQDVEFNAGAFDHGPSGEMYFGGNRGFNAFRPERFTDHVRIPPVVLTSFKVLERERDLGRASPYLEEIELRHHDNFFSFEYAALNYRRPDRNRYRYRLEGLDADWIDAGSRRYASYTKVPPGDYVFRVQGSNDEGWWNEEGASVEVGIRPPTWRTWWAWGCYLLVAAALAALYRGLHRRKLDRARRINERLREADRQKSELIAELEAKNVELERFTYTVSHDLKSPLLTIKGFLGLVRKDVAAGHEERLEHDLERLEAAAEKMAELLDDLLQLSRVGRQMNTVQTVKMNSVVEEAISLLAAEIAERGVEIEVVEGLPPVIGDRNRLVQVMQNLLHNAIKYMGRQPAPKIRVGVRPGEPEAGPPVFFVRDNGLGIEPADRDRVFGLFERLEGSGDGSGVGLALVKRIVEIHGGRIWVESEGRFQGSTFCFTLLQTIRGGKKAFPERTAAPAAEGDHAAR